MAGSRSKKFNVICNSGVTSAIFATVQNAIIGRPIDEKIPAVLRWNIRFCQASIIKDVARLRRRISVVAEKSIDDSFLPFRLFRRLSATISSPARIDCPRPEEIDVVKKTEDAERFAIRDSRTSLPPSSSSLRLTSATWRFRGTRIS